MGFEKVNIVGKYNSKTILLASETCLTLELNDTLEFTMNSQKVSCKLIFNFIDDNTKLGSITEWSVIDNGDIVFNLRNFYHISWLEPTVAEFQTKLGYKFWVKFRSSGIKGDYSRLFQISIWGQQ